MDNKEGGIMSRRIFVLLIIFTTFLCANETYAQSDSSSRKLSQYLRESCNDSFCSFEIHLVGDAIKNVRMSLLPMALDSLEHYLEKVDGNAEEITGVDSLENTVNQILQFCPKDLSCTTLVTLRKKNHTIVEFRKPSAAIHKQEETVSETEAKQPQRKFVETPAPVQEKPKESRHFYLGIGFSLESFDEKETAGFEVNDEDSDDAGCWGGALGLALRWYFYDMGLFQTGMSALLQGAEHKISAFNTSIIDREVYVRYLAIYAEIPLEVRLGIPLKGIFRPFVSFNYTLRKPVYAWTNYSIEYRVGYGSTSWNGSTNDFFEDEEDSWQGGAFQEDDWESMCFWGLGFELTRHITVQFQWMIVAARTYGHEMDPYDADHSGRLLIDLAF